MPVHHLAVRTDDPQRLAAFYCDLLGLTPMRVTNGGAHWLWIDRQAVLMVEPRGPGEPGIPPGSMEFLAMSVPADGLAAFERRAERLGVPIEHRTVATRYVRDPDGRRIGVSCYVFEAPPGADTRLTDTGG